MTPDAMPAPLTVLLQVAVLAFFVERALALVFESRIGVPFFARHRGLKTPIAYGVSLLCCAWWRLDAVGALLGSDPGGPWGFLLTAAAVAGGSKISIKFFRDYLDVRSRYDRAFEREERQRIETTRVGLAEASAPRCANADLVADRAPHRPWPEGDRAVRWWLGEGPADVHPDADNGEPRKRTLGALRSACASWGEALRGAGFDFAEADRPEHANLIFSWVADDPHGQLVGPAVAHATYYGDEFPMVIHFRSGESWSDDPDGFADAIDIESTALHELGHVLGYFDHPGAPGLVMSERIGRGPASVRRRLAPGDLAAMRRVYRSLG